MKPSKTPLVASIVALIMSAIAGFVTLTHQPGTNTVVRSGSVASPDIPSPYFSFGDVKTWGSHAIVASGNQQLCGLTGPQGTSSVGRVSLELTNNLNVAIPVEVGWGATVGATTTVIARGVIPALGSFDLNATNTTAFLTDRIMTQKGSFINFRVASATPTLFAPTAAACNATFDDMN